MITKHDLLNPIYNLKNEEPYWTFIYAIEYNKDSIENVEFNTLEIISHVEGENDGN